MNTNLKKYIQSTGILFLYTMFFCVLLSVIWNILGGGIQKAILPVSMLLASVVLVKTDNYTRKEFASAFVLFVLLFLVLSVISGLACSSAYDSNGYQKLAVGFLKNGWNPARETSAQFAANYFGSTEVYSGTPWLDSYGKTTWYFAANVYQWTNSIETGKVYNLIGILLVFLLSNSYLFEKFGDKVIRNFICSVVLCLNPVFISQMFEYYVDGFMGCMLYILIIGLTMLVDEQFDNGKAWLVIMPSMCLLGNVKFTGLAYGGIFCVTFWAYSIVRKYDRTKMKTYLRRTVNFAVTALMTVGIIGWTSYVNNFVRHKNPLYPLFGEGKRDIMTNNAPAGFAGKTVWYKLLYGIFGKTENLLPDEKRPLPELKIPFTTTAEELGNCQGADIRIGGFGVFFSGILLVSCIVLITFFVVCIVKKVRGEAKGYFMLLTATCVLLMCVVSESWWARYAPQLYLLAAAALAVLMYYSPRKYSVLSIPFAMILMMNSAIWGSAAASAFANHTAEKNAFQEMKSQQMEVIHTIPFTGALFHLEDEQIDYELVFDEDLSGSSTTFFDMIRYRKKSR